MTWTNEPPTRNGFYWYFSENINHPQICTVMNGKRYTYGENGNVVTIFKGCWWGPLDVPEPPPLAVVVSPFDNQGEKQGDSY